jgi:hypothetical protein
MKCWRQEQIASGPRLRAARPVIIQVGGALRSAHADQIEGPALSEGFSPGTPAAPTHASAGLSDWRPAPGGRPKPV